MEQVTATIVVAIISSVASSLVTLGASAFAAYVAWRKLSHRIKQESDVSALSHYEGVIGHLERTIERQGSEIGQLRAHILRQDRHGEEMTGAVRTLHDKLHGCYGWVRRFHSLACENARLAGRDPGRDVPPLPAYDDGDVEHHVRTLAQTSELLRELSAGGPDQSDAGGSE